MCWNADISINTFIFGVFALAFIYITNTYSKYKTKTFDNPLVYLFMFEVASIQLIEYFLWKNLKNKIWNEFLSKVASFVITAQIITLILMVNPLSYRYSMLAFYTIVLLSYFYYKASYDPIIFNTSIGENGHLAWNWTASKYHGNIFLFIFMSLYILPLFFINNFLLSFFVIITLLFSLYFHKEDLTLGTMWCWITNFTLLYFIFDILFIQPFIEYNGLC